MKSAFVLAVFLFLNFICYAADAPLQCASAPSPQSNDEAIFFRITGSTNTPPVCYTVTGSGAVNQVEQEPRGLQKGRARLARPINKGVFQFLLRRRSLATLRRRRRFSDLPKAHCAKSVSFGTVQRVFFKGENSPDLSCGRGDEKIETLKGDLAQIIGTAKFEPGKP